MKDDEQDDACDEDKEGDEEMAVGDDGPGLIAEAQSVLHAITLVWLTLAVTFEQTLNASNSTVNEIARTAAVGGSEHFLRKIFITGDGDSCLMR